MAFSQSRRDVLGLILGGGVLGFFRALFGAALAPPKAAATIPPVATPAITPCPSGELLGVTTRVDDAAGRVCTVTDWRQPRLPATTVYEFDDPGPDPSPPPPPAEDPAGGSAPA